MRLRHSDEQSNLDLIALRSDLTEGMTGGRLGCHVLGESDRA